MQSVDSIYEIPECSVFGEDNKAMLFTGGSMASNLASTVAATITGTAIGAIATSVIETASSAAIVGVAADCVPGPAVPG